MYGTSVIACPPGFGLGFDGSFDSDYMTERRHVNGVFILLSILSCKYVIIASLLDF